VSGAVARTFSTRSSNRIMGSGVQQEERLSGCQRPEPLYSL
jgi:hypothetical protein